MSRINTTTRKSASTPGNAALAGVKVVDLSAQLVAPLMTKYLADYGASVVLVESAAHPTILRVSPPFKDNAVHLDHCYAFLNCGSNKLGIRLNLERNEGLDVLLKLVKWADVVVSNFPSVKAVRLGVSYELLRKANPRIIMLNTTGFGQNGPMTNTPAWGWNLFALAGFPNLLGWPDDEPMPCPIAYSDYLSPWYGVVAIMAALEHRNKTGKGQFIDLAQNEVNLQFLAPPIMEHAANGTQQTRMGNRSLCGAPHGVYQCRGRNMWCAISVFTDDEWQSFRRAMGDPLWARHDKFATCRDRKANESELDALVEEWTRQFTPENIMERLQMEGVAAGVVKTGAAVIAEDPQMKHRGFLKMLDHPAMGPSLHPGTPGKLSLTPSRMTPAPCFGEHTEYVCREIIKMPDEEFLKLLSAGVFD